MATQANSFDTYSTGAAWGNSAPHKGTGEDCGSFELPPVPNQAIYFYRKPIDNSHVVRQADPDERARCLRWIATATAGTFLLVALLWPNVYGMLAGYQVESLRVDQQRLVAERASLDLEEARLLSPEKLEELARTQQFIDPAPQQVVYLPPAPDGALALNRNSH
jgi:hypothetical protein